MLQGERYINPYTDFGFKKLFGSELNKELLVSFLNALFQGKYEIEDVQYLSSEQLGRSEIDRRAIFDVYCTTVNGDRFIVEMQNVYQQFYKDRSVYYSSFPIQEQAKRGDWDFRLQNVYTVGILNFRMPEHADQPDKYLHEVMLLDTQDHKVFYDKLTYYYLEMPKFNKTLNECVTMVDKWLFVLRNLSSLLDRPAKLQERVFLRLFEQAEIARYDKDELQAYEDSMKAYRDINNAINTAKKDFYEKGLQAGMKKGIQQGIQQGKEEGKRVAMLETARNLKSMGMPDDVISSATGLTLEELKDI